MLMFYSFFPREVKAANMVCSRWLPVVNISVHPVLKVARSVKERGKLAGGKIRGKHESNIL